MPRADAIKRKSLRFVPLPGDGELVTGEYSVAIIRIARAPLLSRVRSVATGRGLWQSVASSDSPSVRTTMTPAQDTSQRPRSCDRGLWPFLVWAQRRSDLSIVGITASRGGYRRRDRNAEACQDPGSLTRGKARCEQSVVDLTRDGKAVKFGLLAPRFAPSQRAWVLTGFRVAV